MADRKPQSGPTHIATITADGEDVCAGCCRVPPAGSPAIQIDDSDYYPILCPDCVAAMAKMIPKKSRAAG